VCLFICSSTGLLVCQSVCLPVMLHVCLFVSLSVCQSVCLPVSLSACLSVSLPACLSVCLPVSLPCLADCLSSVLFCLCMLDVASIGSASAVLRNLIDTLGTLWVSCLASLGAAGNVTVGYTLRGECPGYDTSVQKRRLSTQQSLYCSSLSTFQSEYSPVAACRSGRCSS